LPNRGDGFVGSAEICPLQQPGTSTYGDQSAASLSVLMHEVGHNLALNHARGNVDEMYADQTGSMGHSTSQIGGPLACYNAANHWSLQWYSNARIEVKPSTTPVQVTIAAFVDYLLVPPSSNTYVLVKVGTNLYMQYNRAKSYNSGTRDLPDQLVLVRKRTGTNGNTIAGTTLVAGLDLSNPKFGDSSAAVEVCSVNVAPDGIDIMVVSIGSTATNCNSGSSVASNAANGQSSAADGTNQQLGSTWTNWALRNKRKNVNQSSNSMPTKRWRPSAWG
jgi:Gametolysin peptidase M11